MKIKKICSFFVVCMLLCGSVAVLKSQTNTACAMPSEQVGRNEWIVWGDSLHNEISLARTRFCPQGFDTVVRLILTCINEGRRLRVQRFRGNVWSYVIV